MVVKKWKQMSLLLAGVVVLLSACGVEEKPQLAVPETVVPETPSPSPSPTLEPAKVLSVCMGQEPSSLFLYGDDSSAADIIRQAIYDGPVDTVNFTHTPVILEEIPSRENDGVIIDGVEVEPGELFVDPSGHLTFLTEGVKYRPAGCFAVDCVESYEGQGPATMDQVTLRYQLQPAVTWSDGEPLTSEDSLFSYQVAKDIYGEFGPPKVRYVDSYQVVSESEVAWKGLPGYQGFPNYADFFFSPLPRHRWPDITASQLLSEEQARRFPLGWGPFVVQEWVPAERITFTKNERYFRSGEGLPYYDSLVFRFLDDVDEALNAILAGECEIVVEFPGFVDDLAALQEEEREGSLNIVSIYGGAWEQVVFGIQPLDEGGSLFKDKKIRQAVAMCVNREKIVAAMPQASHVANSYFPSGHPFYNEEISIYEYDPQETAALMEEAGWEDHDQNPDTPLQAQNVKSVKEGTPFQFQLLIAPTSKSLMVADLIQKDLEECSIDVQIESLPPQDLLAPGPRGPVFGRDFDAAQFAWTPGRFQLCSLFLSSNIPGYSPEYPMGWGGSNASGYTNEAFDTACQESLHLLPDLETTQEARKQAQIIFAEDLPALPLYFRRDVILFGPELGDIRDGFFTPLWNLEALP